jgi:hypothetical protein
MYWSSSSALNTRYPLKLGKGAVYIYGRLIFGAVDQTFG